MQTAIIWLLIEIGSFWGIENLWGDGEQMSLCLFVRICVFACHLFSAFFFFCELMKSIINEFIDGDRESSNSSMEVSLKRKDRVFVKLLEKIACFSFNGIFTCLWYDKQLLKRLTEDIKGLKINLNFKLLLC